MEILSLSRILSALRKRPAQLLVQDPDESSAAKKAKLDDDHVPLLESDPNQRSLDAPQPDDGQSDEEVSTINI